MPEIISKYKKAPAPNFPKAKKQGLDNFLKASIIEDNANNQSYNPNYELLSKPLNLGIPNFKRFISREYQDKLLFSKHVPDCYDH